MSNPISMSTCPDLLTVPELMSILRVGRNTAYTLINNNEIKHIRVNGKQIRIPKQYLIDYLHSGCDNTGSNGEQVCTGAVRALGGS